MKLLTRWAAVTAVFVLPYLLVMLAGWWWLYERGYLIWWAVCAATLMLLGRWGIQWMNRPRGGDLRSGVQTSPDSVPADERARKKVEEFSQRVQSENWPLDDAERWWQLLRQVFDIVAREYRPESVNPVLEIPVTHLAIIVERVAHDVGAWAGQNMPGSHVLTVNDLGWLKGLASRGGGWYTKFYPLYRGVRMVINPIMGVLRESYDYLLGDVVDSMTSDVKRRLLGFAVSRAGFYAIELYSGKLVLPESYVTQRSADDALRAARQAAALDAEPLRMLVVGQTNAGKSSLINALFDEVKTATDALPTTRNVTPFIFEREGVERALVFDTAGYGAAKGSEDPFAELADHLLACDLIVVVCSAVTAARQSDLSMLEQLRLRFQKEPNRTLPPLIAVLTHIDLLRPFNEWNPPYNLTLRSSEKARQIADAVLVMAHELRVPPEHVVPVCLLPDRLYNVEEGLLPAMIEWLPEAARAKLLRCASVHRDEEYWRRLWQQTVNAGKLLVQGAAAVVRR